MVLIPLHSICRGQGYLINVTGYMTTDNIISTAQYADPANVLVQIEICQNITKPVDPSCNVTAPAYMVCATLIIQ